MGSIKTKLLIIIAIHVLSCWALAQSLREPAAIHRGVMALVKPSQIFYGQDGEGISPDLVANFNQFAKVNPLDASQYIPVSLRPEMGTREVMSKIADRSMSTWFQSDQVQNSFLGRTANNVEETVRSEVQLGGHDEKTHHKLNFELKAFQSQAMVKYTGFANASLTYQLINSSVGLEVSEKVSQEVQMIFSHVAKSGSKISAVSWRWEF
ncbi:MAG: hypothetical protein LW875_04730 [Proteobacteria bacterium]|nr:hypothetical protein [Pseudomonadota bacterium]